ncbi:MAG: hypothetical protein M3P34_11040 [Actinomycetota bacterium]|nr:hypothetical protein [Actinomycetota bacterium]
MTTDNGWRSDEVVAFTEREGPGRAPTWGLRPLTIALAAALAAIFVGIMSTDTLCPEHRAWVEALAIAGLTAVVAAVIGLVRGWGASPALTVVAAVTGVAIGLIDAAHAPERGRLIAGAFAVVVLGAAGLSLLQLRAARWVRSALDVGARDRALAPQVDASAAPAGSAEVDEREETTQPA